MNSSFIEVATPAQVHILTDEEEAEEIIEWESDYSVVFTSLLLLVVRIFFLFKLKQFIWWASPRVKESFRAWRKKGSETGGAFGPRSYSDLAIDVTEDDDEATIHSLPPRCLQRVFSFLNLQDLSTSQRVSRVWYFNAGQDWLWRFHFDRISPDNDLIAPMPPVEDEWLLLKMNSPYDFRRPLRVPRVSLITPPQSPTKTAPSLVLSAMTKAIEFESTRSLSPSIATELLPPGDGNSSIQPHTSSNHQRYGDNTLDSADSSRPDSSSSLSPSPYDQVLSSPSGNVHSTYTSLIESEERLEASMAAAAANLSGDDSMEEDVVVMVDPPALAASPAGVIIPPASAFTPVSKGNVSNHSAFSFTNHSTTLSGSAMQSTYSGSTHESLEARLDRGGIGAGGVSATNLSTKSNESSERPMMTPFTAYQEESKGNELPSFALDSPLASESGPAQSPSSLHARRWRGVGHGGTGGVVSPFSQPTSLVNAANALGPHHSKYHLLKKWPHLSAKERYNASHFSLIHSPDRSSSQRQLESKVNMGRALFLLAFVVWTLYYHHLATFVLVGQVVAHIARATPIAAGLYNLFRILAPGPERPSDVRAEAGLWLGFCGFVLFGIENILYSYRMSTPLLWIPFFIAMNFFRVTPPFLAVADLYGARLRYHLYVLQRAPESSSDYFAAVVGWIGITVGVEAFYRLFEIQTPMLEATWSIIGPYVYSVIRMVPTALLLFTLVGMRSVRSRVHDSSSFLSRDDDEEYGRHDGLNRIPSQSKRRRGSIRGFNWESKWQDYFLYHWLPHANLYVKFGIILFGELCLVLVVEALFRNLQIETPFLAVYLKPIESMCLMCLTFAIRVSLPALAFWRLWLRILRPILSEVDSWSPQSTSPSSRPSPTHSIGSMALSPVAVERGNGSGGIEKKRHIESRDAGKGGFLGPVAGSVLDGAVSVGASDTISFSRVPMKHGGGANYNDSTSVSSKNADALSVASGGFDGHALASPASVNGSTSGNGSSGAASNGRPSPWSVRVTLSHMTGATSKNIVVGFLLRSQRRMHTMARVLTSASASDAFCSRTTETVFWLVVLFLTEYLYFVFQVHTPLLTMIVEILYECWWYCELLVTALTIYMISPAVRVLSIYYSYLMIVHPLFVLAHNTAQDTNPHSTASLSVLEDGITPAASTSASIAPASSPRPVSGPPSHSHILFVLVSVAIVVSTLLEMDKTEEDSSMAFPLFWFIVWVFQ